MSKFGVILKLERIYHIPIRLPLLVYLLEIPKTPDFYDISGS
jgi:hypothetical protein